MFIKQTLRLFQIRKEERPAAITACIAFTILNALNVIRYFSGLSNIPERDWGRFIKEWHLAGFDPLTYSVITEWGCNYNIYRHPLLAYFVWPFSKLNEGLMALTGLNFATIITAILLVFFATYSFIFLSRIFWEIIGTKRSEAYILSALNFSFAFVMLATLAPDHFCPSMFCLILTLYLCGRKLQRGRALNWWQTILMFIFTAGISLNNGLKIFLAALVTRRKKFFKPGYLIVAIILPAALMWGGARLSYRYFVWPKEVARKTKTMEARKHQLERLQDKAISNANAKDTARISFIKDSVAKQLQANRDRRHKMSAYYKHTGKPIVKGEFMGWTDITTNRWDVATECLFGEGIMLHQDYLLGDVLVNRPVIVHYRNWFNYIIEGAIVVLFIIGIWRGSSRRREGTWKVLLLWTALSMFLMDMVLHMGLGFGINEISIMSAHYLFVIPIAMGFIFTNIRNERYRKALSIGIAGITAYIAFWNITLLVEYLYFM